MSGKKLRPAIRWIGGKTSAADLLLEHVPATFATYHEPFCGGFGFFLRLWSEERLKRFQTPAKAGKTRLPLEDTEDVGLDRARGPYAFLSDANPELIGAMRVLRDDLDGLFDMLLFFYKAGGKSVEKLYPWVRDTFVPKTDAERAARFFFLNFHAYNGLFRCNKAGKFNVPPDPGRFERCPDVANLLAVSTAIQRVQFHLGDWSDALKVVREGDLCYFDPPYCGTFAAYTAVKFDDEDRLRLRDALVGLVDRSVHVLLTEADTDLIRTLYADEARFAIHETVSTQNVAHTVEGRKKRNDLIVVGKTR